MPWHKTHSILSALGMIAACLLAFRNLPFHNLDVASSVSTSKLVVHHRSGSVHIRIVGSRHIALANTLILISLHKGKLAVLHKVRSLVCAHPSTNLGSIGTLSVNDSSHRRVELTIHLLHSAIHSESLLLVKAVQLILVCNFVALILILEKLILILGSKVKLLLSEVIKKLGKSSFYFSKLVVFRVFAYHSADSIYQLLIPLLGSRYLSQSTTPFR